MSFSPSLFTSHFPLSYILPTFQNLGPGFIPYSSFRSQIQIFNQGLYFEYLTYYIILNDFQSILLKARIWAGSTEMNMIRIRASEDDIDNQGNYNKRDIIKVPDANI